jgi:hypothetical protein
MLSPSSKAFWIAFPLAVTAVSVLGVTRLRHDAARSGPAAAPQTAAAPAGNEASTPAPSPPPEQITVPANTEIEVRLDRSIATNRVTDGDPFYATVADPVVVDGQSVIPAGAPVQGKILSVREAGRFHGVAELRLALDSVELNGNYYDLSSSIFTRLGHNHKKRNWEMIGGGSGGGALIGALAGGAKGLLIGAPIGAAAGAFGDAATEKRNIVIPAETAMTFTLLDPVTIRL